MKPVLQVEHERFRCNLVQICGGFKEAVENNSDVALKFFYPNELFATQNIEILVGKIDKNSRFKLAELGWMVFPNYMTWQIYNLLNLILKQSPD